MLLIDTHTHVYLQEFDHDKKKMILDAEKEGVIKILLPAIDSESHLRVFEFENEFPGIASAMMGLHPCSVKENYRDELAIARGYLEKRSFIAVGEIGLDFYWDKTFTDQQYAAFHEQLDWALHFDLPVSIHSRNSTNECLAVVKEHQKGKLKGVFHCFSGDVPQAEKAIELGFHLGIGGVITFKNSGLDRVMETISLEHVVLETDAPYLAPVPFRGKRNEPSYLRYVVEKLAVIKNVSTEEVATVTTANAKKLFGI